MAAHLFSDHVQRWVTDDDSSDDETVNDLLRDVWDKAYSHAYDDGYDLGLSDGIGEGAANAFCPSENEHAESLEAEAPFLTDLDARLALAAIILDAARNPNSSLRWESARAIRSLTDWANANSNAYRWVAA